MRRILTGEIPRHMITFDGVRNVREETFLPLEWKQVGNEMYVTWEPTTGVPRPVGRAKPIVKGR